MRILMFYFNCEGHLSQVMIINHNFEGKGLRVDTALKWQPLSICGIMSDHFTCKSTSHMSLLIFIGCAHVHMYICMHAHAYTRTHVGWDVGGVGVGVSGPLCVCVCVCVRVQ